MREGWGRSEVRRPESLLFASLVLRPRVFMPSYVPTPHRPPPPPPPVTSDHLRHSCDRGRRRSYRSRRSREQP